MDKLKMFKLNLLCHPCLYTCTCNLFCG